MTPNPFYIDYLITKTPGSQLLIGTRTLLVAEARAMNPEEDKFERADSNHAKGFESTILRQWQEISVTVNGILNGSRDQLDIDDLSKLKDFQQFYQSAANGQPMVLDARKIGGVDKIINVKLISRANTMQRQKTKQKYNTTFKLQVVE